MSVEIPYTDDFTRAERVFGYQLHDPSLRQGDVLTLNEPQRFTALSVISGLERALAQDKAEAAARGETLDRQNWFPSDEAATEIYEEHRAHRRYLRGLQGLKTYYEYIQGGAAQGDVELYEHQDETLDSVISYMETHDPFAEDSQGAYADISGGGGKSRIIAMVAEGFKFEENPEDPNRVLIIAADNEGVKELVGEDGRSGLGRYTPDLRDKIGVVNKDSKQHDAEVVITTRESARRMLEEDPQAFERYDLIEGDEVHKLLGTKTKAVVQGVRRTIIGFTGSSEYSKDKKVSDLLPEVLIERGKRKLLLGDKLSPRQFWVCKTGQVIYEKTGRMDYTPDELLRISKMPERHKIMADAGLAFFRDNRNGVFACNTIAEATSFAEAMDGTVVTLADGRQRTIRVMPVYGKSEQDNHHIFRMLNDDEIQAVTIVDIDTGWDVLRASFIVNGRPTKSKIRAGQRDARVSRKYTDADGIVVTAQSFDLVDVVRKKTPKTNWDTVSVSGTSATQVLAPSLYGETIYHAGMVLASPATDGKRRDFHASQFPQHIRWAVTMADGVSLAKLPAFGAGAIRDQSPEGLLNLGEAARGLAVPASRLGVALAVAGVSLRGGKYLNEEGMGKAENYFLNNREQIW
jgi:superfamily II DNA or RNA helicase